MLVESKLEAVPEKKRFVGLEASPELTKISWIRSCSRANKG